MDIKAQVRADNLISELVDALEWLMEMGACSCDSSPRMCGHCRARIAMQHAAEYKLGVEEIVGNVAHKGGAHA